MKELADFYVTNSDDTFLKQTVSKKLVDSVIEKEVLSDLLDRKLFKRVFQAKIILIENDSETIDSVKEIRKKIDLKLFNLNAENIYAVSDMFENKTYKDSDLKPILIARKVGKKYEFIEDWKNTSREFSLANMNVAMIRIYLKRTFSNSSDFEMMKEKIMLLLKEELDELKKFPA